MKLDEFAQEVIKAVKANTAPWQREWDLNEAARSLPFNLSTGKDYRGVNTLRLWLAGLDEGFSSNGWMTYNQAKSEGAHVRRGESGSAVFFFTFKEEKDDENEDETIKRPIFRCFTVFNRDQIEGLPEPKKIPEPKFSPVDACEKLLACAKIEFGGNRAYYSPATDSIRLPERGQFETANAFYSTAIHELAHWTGAKSRLARDMGKSFGDDKYAAEELVAEITSWLLAVTLGTPHNPQNSAAYIDGWCKILGKRSTAIMTACSQAQKAVDYLLETAGLKES